MSMYVYDAVIQRNHWPMRENKLHFLVKFYINGFIYDGYFARLISYPIQTVIISQDQNKWSSGISVKMSKWTFDSDFFQNVLKFEISMTESFVIGF